MGDRQFEPAAFKAGQREQWSNVAQGWRTRWPVFERGAQPLSDRMMDLAHIGPGQRVLDMATGIGEPAMTAARWIGPSGMVTAIDQAPQMLAVAHERMRTAGVQNVELIEGDAEAITLPADFFNAVVCRWGLMFFQDPATALARWRSSLVPGGWLVAAIWGSPERVPMISLPFSALRGDGTQPTSLPPGPNPFALSLPTSLEQVLRDAGFAQVQCESSSVTFRFDSVDELLGHMRDVSAPIRMIMATSSPERQAEFWEKLAVAAIPFTEAGGKVRVANECLIASGQRR